MKRCIPFVCLFLVCAMCAWANVTVSHQEYSLDLVVPATLDPEPSITYSDTSSSPISYTIGSAQVGTASGSAGDFCVQASTDPVDYYGSHYAQATSACVFWPDSSSVTIDFTGGMEYSFGNFPYYEIGYTLLDAMYYDGLLMEEMRVGIGSENSKDFSLSRTFSVEADHPYKLILNAQVRPAGIDVSSGTSWLCAQIDGCASPVTPVPVPGAIWLGVMGGAGVGWLKKRVANP